MQQLPRAELRWTRISLGMRLYSSYHTLPKGNTGAGGTPQHTFLLSPLTLSQVEALHCPRQHLFPYFCRVVKDWQVQQRRPSMLGQLLWVGSGVPSWKAEGWMTLLSATLRRLSAWLGSLLSLHSLQEAAASQTGWFSTGGCGIMLTSSQSGMNPANTARTPSRNQGDSE